MLIVVVAAALSEEEPAVVLPPPLAGLSLPLRQVLTAQQQGASRILWLGSAACGRALAADARLSIPLQQLPPHHGLIDLTRLRAQVRGPFVMLDVRWLLAPRYHRALIALAKQWPPHDVPPNIHYDPCDAGHFGARALVDGHFVHALVGTPALLAKLAQQPRGWQQLGAWDALTEHPLEGGWHAPANTPAGRQHAFTQLFEACRKPVDGVVSRHLNRHLSLWLSKRLVNTPITPNTMTAVTFAVGLVAAYQASRGGYGHIVLGAALMQLNSILDGCDGELARVRFQGSKLGQWLDTVGDDVSNVIFWLALGVAAQKLPHYGGWLAACAWMAAAGNGLAAAQYYLQLRRLGSGDFYAIQAHDKPPPAGFLGAAVRFFSVVLKQDFFLLLVLMLALANVLLWSLPVMAVGALITLASATGRTLTQRRRRAAD